MKMEIEGWDVEVSSFEGSVIAKCPELPFIGTVEDDDVDEGLERMRERLAHYNELHETSVLRDSKNIDKRKERFRKFFESFENRMDEWETALERETRLLLDKGGAPPPENDDLREAFDIFKGGAEVMIRVAGEWSGLVSELMDARRVSWSLTEERSKEAA